MGGSLGSSGSILMLKSTIRLWAMAAPFGYSGCKNMFYLGFRRRRRLFKKKKILERLHPPILDESDKPNPTDRRYRNVILTNALFVNIFFSTGKRKLI
jgi:hypothetical protein